MLPRVSGSLALSSGRRRGGIFACSAGLVLLPFFVHGVASAQSTSGTVLGTMKDPHGEVVAGAVVKLLNTGTNTDRSTRTGETGSFQFSNLDVGTYRLEISAPGFEQLRFAKFDLGARETKRVDADLRIASQTTSVNVEATAGIVIETDTSSIAETKGARELVDLPVAITARASGSTSAMSTLTAQPGVQTDANGNISVPPLCAIDLYIADRESSTRDSAVALAIRAFPPMTR